MAVDNTARIGRLKALLDRYEGLGHIWIRSWGKSLVLCSGDTDDRWERARVTEVGRNLWQLSLPRPTSGWDKTPFVGPIDEVVDTLVTHFGWHLEPE